MREFKKVSLDGKGGDIAGDRAISSRNAIESFRYSRPESQFASEEFESSAWAWREDTLSKPQTGVKPVPANMWKGNERLTKPYDFRETESSEFKWKYIRRIFKF